MFLETGANIIFGCAVFIWFGVFFNSRQEFIWKQQDRFIDDLIWHYSAVLKWAVLTCYTNCRCGPSYLVSIFFKITITPAHSDI